MGNKKIPDEVVTAMELAKAAGWQVSNRNKMIHIVCPDGINISISHNPNDESMKVFRSNARKYNLTGQGPARTREEVEALMKAAEAEGQAEADRLNEQRKAYEAEQKRKAAEIRAAREKANAAIQQGLMSQETTMPKRPTSTPSTVRSSKIPAKRTTARPDVPSQVTAEDIALFPSYDPALLGTRDNSQFLLADGRYYCIECLSKGDHSIIKAPQGLAAHRGRWHGLYADNDLKTQETSRVSLPTDVETAVDMLRTVMAEALAGSADPKALADKEAELVELRTKLEEVVKQADADRADFDKRFLEAQVSADKKLADLRTELEGVRKAEVNRLTQEFYKLLKSIQGTAEQLSPIQAIAKIDEIVRNFTA